MAAAKKKAKSSVRRKAPVGNTGGDGFSFENAVAARFILDLFGGTHTLGMESFGKVVRLDWQARESGWLLDDLVVTSQTRTSTRTAGISIKSGQKVTVQGFPTDFIVSIWSQWFGDCATRSFARTADVVVLATGQGTHAAKVPWNRLLREILATSSDRIVERLADNKGGGQQTSKQERAIFGSFSCPGAYQREHAGDKETVDLIRQVRWLDFDYDSPTSQDYSRAIADCTAVLSDADASRAADLWEKLKGIADDKRKVGGTLNLPVLLAELHGQFSFRDNPDYAADWAALRTRSETELAGIKTEIAGLPRLERKAELAAIADAVNDQRACFLIGDSGCGKSAIAKEFAAGKYSRIIWLNGDTLDCASLPDFEKSLGLSHGIAEVIDATIESTIIVLDAVEGYTQRAKKVATQIVNSVRSTAAAKRTAIIVTAQAEAASALAFDLYSGGFPSEIFKTTPLDRPAEGDVRAMVSGLPKVGWVALNPDIRSLLANLKMLDWFVQFAQSGGTINTANVGLTNLIDSLWAHWVESGADRFARSHLLKQIATIEADRHISVVPTSALGHAERTTLGKISDGELLRVRNERIQFSHDLLSDWSRLKVLVGEDWLASPAAREQYTSPKWFRAIRLYGQRLLEQSADNSESWQKELEAVNDGTPTGTLIRDLFLEALFLAPNAAALLRQAWPVLAANRGKLLKVMINRFLYVATVPDPRLALIFSTVKDTSVYEHLMRYPYWPYWGPLISVVHERRAEIAKLVPNEAASVCAMWLRSMDLPGSYKIPWRQEAAELAYAIAREAQMQEVVREPFSYCGSKMIYEALLLASPEMPTDVGQLCLELADRRDLHSTIAAKAAEARAKQAEERAKAAATAPKRKSRPEPMMSMRGPLRNPWPDGPRSRVDHEFVRACLDGNAYGAFAKANPDAALEVLLAVCIEEPQHEEYGSSSRDELGLNYWRGGDPAIWFRGPFFTFLSAAPEHGISFVIKLTNFVTDRYGRGEGETFNISGKKRRWRGDANVFTWHNDGHLMRGSILQSALMALEKWLYDRIDAGADIVAVVTRIMNESESLAFAGLLLTVAKRKPDLLTGPLSPLLARWMLIEWDLQLTSLRNSGQRSYFGYWGHQPEEAIKIAQDWTGMPHRRVSIRDLLAQEFLPLKEHGKFFGRLLATWRKELSEDRTPVELRRLIESLRKSNYQFGLLDGKTAPIAFKSPPEDEAEDIELAQNASENLLFITLPLQSRKVLDAATPIGADQVEPLADVIKRIHEKGGGQSDDVVHTTQDVVLAGVAVLICLHYEWLVANPARLAWCHERLQEAADTPSIGPDPYSAFSRSNDKWDAFATECGVSLLARDRTDPLARKLVAQGITSVFYSTTQLVVNRAARNNVSLGDDFKRVIRAVLEWSAIRPVISASRIEPIIEIEQYSERRFALETRFVECTLEPVLPDLTKLNTEARKKLDEIHANRYPEHAAFVEARARARQRKASRSRVELHPDLPGFDERLVRAALSWLRPDAETPFSRFEIVSTIRTLLGIVLASVPQVRDHETEDIRGLPSDFDYWIYELVATAIPLLTPAEKSEELWQPILDLDPRAHQWVEWFYWQWFTLGSKVKVDFADFFREWRAMIEFALGSSQWDHKKNRHHEIDGMVFELLGFDPRWTVWINTEGAGPFVERMSDLYERAAARWFSLPKVLSGFVRFVQHPAAFALAIKSIPWIASAVRDYDHFDWRYGTEENVIDFLHTCWQRDANKITADGTLRTAFFEIVKILAARGSHAALALQNRVSSRTLG